MNRPLFSSISVKTTSIMLLSACATVFLTGCETPLKVKRTWSSQKAWDIVENGEGFDPTTLVIDGQADETRRARADFESKAQAAAVGSLPPGGLESLLDDINEPFVKTVVSATPNLVGGGSGIIVLGDFVGPDNRPLATDAGGKVNKAKFLTALQTTPGIKGQWYVMAMTVEEVQRILENANAVPGQAVKLGSYEFIYNPKNIYQMRLSVSAKSFAPQNQIVYTGIATLHHVETGGTQVQGQGDAKATYFYQPYGKEWLIEAEEKRRRTAERTIEGRTDPTPAADGSYPAGFEPDPDDV